MIVTQPSQALFVAWQQPDSRRYFPVGRLAACPREAGIVYEFAYIRGAAEAAKETHAKASLSAEECAKQTERQSLLLSRAQVVSRLKTAKNARYRAQLEKALKDLDEELVAMDLEKRLMN